MKDAIHAKLDEHVKGSGCSVACYQEVAEMLHSIHCIPHSACEVGSFMLLLQVLLMLKLSCLKSSQGQGGASALWNSTTTQQLHMPKHCWAATTSSEQSYKGLAGFVSDALEARQLQAMCNIHASIAYLCKGPGLSHAAPLQTLVAGMSCACKGLWYAGWVTGR